MRASSFRRNTLLTSSAIRAAVGGLGESKRAKTSRICGTVNAGVFPPQQISLKLQEPQGQDRQRQVVVPAPPRADFIMIQTDLAFPRAEQLFGAMPSAMHLDQLRQRNLGRGVRQRVPAAWVTID